MAKRKKKLVMDPSQLKSALWNPPVGTPEVNNEPSVVVPGGEIKLTSLKDVLDVVNGSQKLEARYDEPGTPFPVARRRGANLMDVVDTVKSDLIERLTQNEIQSKKLAEKRAAAAAQTAAKAAGDPASASANSGVQK